VDPDFEIQDAVLAERRFQDRWRGYLEDLGREPDAVQVVDRVLSLGLATRDIGTLAWALWSQQHLASLLEKQPLVVAGAAWPDLGRNAASPFPPVAGRPRAERTSCAWLSNA